MTPDELDDLIFRYLSGSLAEAEHRKLETLLTTDSNCGRRFAELSLQETLLVGMGEEAAALEKAASTPSSSRMMPAASRQGFVVRAKPRRAIRKPAQPYFLIGALAAAVILLAVGVHYYNAPQVENVRAMLSATVIETRGSATLRSGSQVINVSNGMLVAPGETLKCAQDSAVRVRYPDSTTLQLNGDTELALLELQSAKGKAMRINMGRIDAEVAPQPPGAPLTIETSGARAEVVGTKFSLGATGDITRLDVQEGRVALTRLSDQSRVQVGAGEFAEASPSTQLTVSKIEPPREPIKPLVEAPKTQTVLFHLDFEDGRARADSIGKVVAGPARPDNKFCFEGKYTPDDKIVRVRLGDNKNGIFTYRAGAVLTFDYWVDERISEIIVYAWDRNQQDSFGNGTPFTPKTKTWTRATVRLTDFHASSGKKLRDGSFIVDMTIQTGPGNGTLFIDNVDVAVPDTKPPPNPRLNK